MFHLNYVYLVFTAFYILIFISVTMSSLSIFSYSVHRTFSLTFLLCVPYLFLHTSSLYSPDNCMWLYFPLYSLYIQCYILNIIIAILVFTIVITLVLLIINFHFQVLFFFHFTYMLPNYN